MEYLWLFLVVMTLGVYPVVLIRSAIRGKRWALDTLEAMRYLGGDMMTTSTWRSLPPEPEPPEEAQASEQEPAEQSEESGRLVA